MTDGPRCMVIRTDDIEPFTHPADPAYHSQHVLGEETTGRHDLLLNQGTVDPHGELGGGNHPDNDEIYYVVSGRTLVDLGGDPVDGTDSETYRLVPGTVVFIPAGTFHRLRNDTAESLVILTIWPQPAKPGANGVHDERLETWGTGFRLREGRELVRGRGAARVIAPNEGWDPRVTG
jgi:mannose-6-phosphate isomerase-like protein (cupin superfamily)